MGDLWMGPTTSRCPRQLILYSRQFNRKQHSMNNTNHLWNIFRWLCFALWRFMQYSPSANFSNWRIIPFSGWLCFITSDRNGNLINVHHWIICLGHLCVDRLVFLKMHRFWYDILSVLCRSCLAFHTLWRHDVPFDFITYFPYFLTYSLTSWHTFDTIRRYDVPFNIMAYFPNV